MSAADDRRLEIAQFRYKIIAEAVEAERGCLTEALKQISNQEMITTSGESFRCSQRQLWRWIAAFKKNGLKGLQPKLRTDIGKPRTLSKEVLAEAIALRQEGKRRATKTLIDILVRKKIVQKGKIKHSTLDRHLAARGMSRRALRTLGEKVFRKIFTAAPLELLVADFHHGPYVRLPGDDKVRKSLLLAFIDHFSRYIPEGRYYIHEDFEALRFGFRNVLTQIGPFKKLYVDNGPSFQAGRFHAACVNKDLDVLLLHSKPYQAEGRGVVERFNRTLKEQFETEIRLRDDVLTLDELNAYFVAWLTERYHRDIHSETQEPPLDRFRNNVVLREPLDIEKLDELLRLRKKAKVHPKWSTVECQGVRYSVHPKLRGSMVHVLYDAMDKSHVLIEQDGQIIERAQPQKPGQEPIALEEVSVKGQKEKTDYLELLKNDYDKRVKFELQLLDLCPADIKKELTYTDFLGLLKLCRVTELDDFEKNIARAAFRKLRPIEPEFGHKTIQTLLNRLGNGLHIRSYTDAFETALVQHRIKSKQKGINHAT